MKYSNRFVEPLTIFLIFDMRQNAADLFMKDTLLNFNASLYVENIFIGFYYSFNNQRITKIP